MESGESRSGSSLASNGVDMQAMGVLFLRNPKPNSEGPSAGVRKALSSRNRTIRLVECTEFCTHCPRFVEEFCLILFFQTTFLFFVRTRMVRRRSALEIVTIQPSTPSSPSPDPVGALEGRALATWNLAGSSTAWFCPGPQSGLSGWDGGGASQISSTHSETPQT